MAGDVAQSGASKIDLMDEFAPGLGFRPRGILGLSHGVVAASLGYKKGPRLRERVHLVSTLGELVERPLGEIWRCILSCLMRGSCESF